MRMPSTVIVLASLLLHSAAYGLQNQTTAPLQAVLAQKMLLDQAALAPGIDQALHKAPQGIATELSRSVVEIYAQTTLQLISSRRVSPPRAARSLAFTFLALHEAQQLARQSGRAMNTDWAAQVAANRMLQYLYPLDVPALQQLLRQAPHPASVQIDRASRHLGHAVADQIIALARQDGASQAGTLKITLPTAEGSWAALPGQQALEPGWGQVRPLLLVQEELPAVAPPPAWDTAVFQDDRRAFLDVQAKLTSQHLQQANYWAAGAGTVTPLGMWIEKALLLSRQHALTGEQLSNVLALTAIAGHNAFIACWDAKFRYNVARPANWVTVPGWQPAIATPPFPSYPSGHATVSGAAAEILANFFPEDRTELWSEARAAADSRVYGGIHWAIDGSQGLDAGQRVANATLNKIR